MVIMNAYNKLELAMKTGRRLYIAINCIPASTETLLHQIIHGISSWQFICFMMHTMNTASW